MEKGLQCYVPNSARALIRFVPAQAKDVATTAQLTPFLPLPLEVQRLLGCLIEVPATLGSSRWRPLKGNSVLVWLTDTLDRVILIRVDDSWSASDHARADPEPRPNGFGHVALAVGEGVVALAPTHLSPSLTKAIRQNRMGGPPFSLPMLGEGEPVARAAWVGHDEGEGAFDALHDDREFSTGLVGEERFAEALKEADEAAKIVLVPGQYLVGLALTLDRVEGANKLEVDLECQPGRLDAVRAAFESAPEHAPPEVAGFLQGAQYSQSGTRLHIEYTIVLPPQ